MSQQMTYLDLILCEVRNVFYSFSVELLENHVVSECVIQETVSVIFGGYL